VLRYTEGPNGLHRKRAPRDACAGWLLGLKPTTQMLLLDQRHVATLWRRTEPMHHVPIQPLASTPEDIVSSRAKTLVDRRSCGRREPRRI
jgi:hypothetical protein